jgi:hypothetical protein
MSTTSTPTHEAEIAAQVAELQRALSAPRYPVTRSLDAPPPPTVPLCDVDHIVGLKAFLRRLRAANPQGTIRLLSERAGEIVRELETYGLLASAEAAQRAEAERIAAMVEVRRLPACFAGADDVMLIVVSDSRRTLTVDGQPVTMRAPVSWAPRAERDAFIVAIESERTARVRDPYASKRDKVAAVLLEGDDRWSAATVLDAFDLASADRDVGSDALESFVARVMDPIALIAWSLSDEEHAHLFDARAREVCAKPGAMSYSAARAQVAELIGGGT